MSTYRISYAQNREDIFLNALLKEAKRGFYVDVGANHPVHESVTKLFYDKGWSGINIEPSNRLHALLSLVRPRDINLKLGVSNQEGELNFREYTLGDGLSTFSNEIQKEYEKDENYRYFAKDYVDHKVPVTTLASLLEKYASGKRIDFMKIDVEGYEYEAVIGNDWSKYRPVIVCIEANHIIKDWHPILKKADYEQVFWDGLNEYFVAKEHAGLTDDFSYADSVFFGTPYIGWSEYKVRQDLKRDNALLTYKLDRERRVISSLQESLTASRRHRDKPSTLSHNLKKVDAKVTTFLKPTARTFVSKRTGLEPQNLEELTVALKEQLTKNQPSKHSSKVLLHGGYKTGKKIIRRTARRGRRS